MDGQQFVLSEATAARRRLFMTLVDATDGITAETGEGSGQPEISKNGAAFANTTATLTHVASGCYYVELTAAELDTLGKVVVRFKSANTTERQVVAMVGAANIFDTVRLGLTALPNAVAAASGGLLTFGTSTGQINTDGAGNANADVREWLGTAVTTDGTTSKPQVDCFSISGDSTAANNCELMFDGTGYAGGTAKLGVDVVSISGDTTAADKAEAYFEGLLTGTVNDASATVSQCTLSAGFAATADIYNGAFLLSTSGTYAGIARKITRYTSGRIAFFEGVTGEDDEPWPAGLANASTVVIIGKAPV